jgi:hypothetical protein
MAVVLLVWVTLNPPPVFRGVTGQQEDQQRDIEAKEVLKSRRRGKNPTPNNRYYYQPRLRGTRDGRRPGSKRTPKNIDTTASFPIEELSKNESYLTVGVTLWGVQVASEIEKQDSKVTKERMTWDQQEHLVVVKRVSDESPIPNQELLQMTIEYLPDQAGPGPRGSNRAAYLYVINREQFLDGSIKNARLIFPTLLTYGGDNRLLPGKTVTLPDPTRPFRIKRDATAQSQAYETYTIILSPRPLDSQLPREISRRAMELSPELVAAWERQMGITEVRADLRDGVGQVRTQRELGASGDTDELRGTEDSAEDLTQDDLPPQIVFRKKAKPDAGMLVIVRVPFKEPLKRP